MNDDGTSAPFEGSILCAAADDVDRQELFEHVSRLGGPSSTAWHLGSLTGSDVDSLELDRISKDKVVVILVSPELLATGCCDHESIRHAVQQHESRSTCLVPVILRPTDYQTTPFGQLPALPDNGVAISDWTDRRAAMNNVAQGIARSIEQFLGTADRPTHEFTVKLPPQSLNAVSTQSFAKEKQALSEAKQQQESNSPASQDAASTLEQIGRYKIKDVLGKGAFGAVYQAHDTELERLVAIKVPHRHRISKPSDIESYLDEARMVAKLDHPNLVPVYDVGRTEDNLCYVVSRFIEGEDLSKYLHRGRVSYTEVARIVAVVSEALHYAHEHDLVHRDVKPANILMDRGGVPYVTDFGLAMKDEDFGKGPKRAGTPAYMSPEQARGEGHRVDGRSDVFSLGVVMYELLTGRLPFRSKRVDDLLDQIARTEAKPPRQFEASIPRELERICLKAMSNRIRDRYTTARDMAEDLWFYLENTDVSDQQSSAHHGSGSGSYGVRSSDANSAASGRGSASARPSSGVASSSHRSGGEQSSSARDVGASSTQGGRHGSTARSSTHSSSRSHFRSSSQLRVRIDGESTCDGEISEKIVPKVLRAFDQDDADFFLRLVPGPRDRYGLPDSLRFWKTRIESQSADNTFSVGVMYGPSGCGKTSLVQAGLLPHLSDEVICVCVEAAVGRTEDRLERKIKRLSPNLSPDLGLSALVAQIRRGHGIRRGAKLLLVIDQFEQWLHGTPPEDQHELLEALRQCDGVRIQCLLLVRVDFMMGIHRFMTDLEVPIEEGTNSAPVDLFDTLHAKNVLVEFGGSYGRLFKDDESLSADQEAFLERAVDELAVEGKVIPVHLSLFADMFQHKEWTTEALRNVGGARGIGATFLEETFSATTAPLEHRVHEEAARGVLRELLPIPGNDLKGHMKSRDVLLAAAGYSQRSKDFATLLSILDGQTRLITPTESDDATSPSGEASPTPHYQLTHDYLVSSLRQWLTKKQKETAKGRAQIRLADRSDLWNAKPENRHLPSLFEYANIQTLTRRTEWTQQEHSMMRQANRFHGARLSAAALVAVILVVASWLGYDRVQSLTAHRIVRNVATAGLSQLPIVILDAEQYSSRTTPLLKSLFDDPNPAEFADNPIAAGKAKFNAGLALLAFAEDKTPYQSWAVEEIRNATPETVKVIADLLADNPAAATDALWQKLAESEQKDSKSVLNYASTLAIVDPNSTEPEEHRWTPEISRAIARHLTSYASPAFEWIKPLQLFETRLFAPLQQIVRSPDRNNLERWAAGTALSEYVSNDQGERVRQLAELLIEASHIANFEAFIKTMEQDGKAGIELLEKRLHEYDVARLKAETVEQKEELTRKELRLAVALLRLEKPDHVWPKLRHSEDPSLRSYLIDALAVYQTDPNPVWQQLLQEKDPSTRCALVLCLGQYDAEQLTKLPSVASSVLTKMYREDKDRGLHSAVEWLLRRWKQRAVIDEFDAKLPSTSEDELPRLIKQGREWYINGQNHTMAILPAQVTFTMGSPPTEQGREGATSGNQEKPHLRTIPRQIAIATKEVTVAQFTSAWESLQLLAEFKKADEADKGDKADSALRTFNYNREFAPSPDCPINQVTWYHAAAYCNWLSAQEQIPRDQWCYVTAHPTGFQEAKFASGMRLRDDYLQCTGYRLPTEAEWEFACRAGAETSRFYGETEDLLPRYAWYDGNTNYSGTVPVGSLKPNDSGLFDIFGNVVEWCQSPLWGYPLEEGSSPFVDTEVKLTVVDSEMMMMRGGGFEYKSAMVRSAARERSRPKWQYYTVGFRVARTLPAVAKESGETHE